MLESNALFLPRPLWDELGGYDAAFVEPGGGVVNPDTYLRACALPDVQQIRIVGEGTFHQIHGGVSTSTPESAIAVLQTGSRLYRPLALSAPSRHPGPRPREIWCRPENTARLPPVQARRPGGRGGGCHVRYRRASPPGTLGGPHPSSCRRSDPGSRNRSSTRRLGASCGWSRRRQPNLSQGPVGRPLDLGES